MLRSKSYRPNNSSPLKGRSINKHFPTIDARDRVYPLHVQRTHITFRREQNPQWRSTPSSAAKYTDCFSSWRCLYRLLELTPHGCVPLTALMCVWVQIAMCKSVPIVGDVLGFLTFSWLFALYCQEYKWNQKAWSFERRIGELETHW